MEEDTAQKGIDAERLAAAIEQAGASCTSSKHAFINFVKSQAVEVNEVTAARLLALLIRNAPDGQANSSLAAALSALSINEGGKPMAAVVVEGLRDLAPSLDWGKVIASLDHSGFKPVTSPAGFATLVAAHRLATSPATPFPLAALCGGPWTRAPVAQLSLLRQAVVAPPELFSFEHCTAQLPPLAGLAGNASAVGTPNRAWLCIDLVRVLCSLADTHATAVRAVMEPAMQHCPEVLTATLAAAAAAHPGRFARDLLTHLLAAFLAGHANSAPVLRAAWSRNRAAVLAAATALIDRDTRAVPRVAAALDDLGVLTDVARTAAPPLCLEMAAAAAAKGALEPDDWLRERLPADGAAFLSVVLQHLIAQLQQQRNGNDLPVLLSAECLGAVLRVAGAYAASLPPNLAQQLKAVEALARSLHPGLTDLQPDPPAASPLPEAGPYAQDVEQEATALLQRVYTGDMSVPDAVGTLQRLKTSGDARERVVFDCVLHSLLDEYRFLTQYPPAELQLAAQLFGQLVRHRLVSSLSLGVALKYVRDALRAGPTSPMAVFGVTALRQFAADLPLWPQYVRELATVPVLRDLAPDVADALDKAVAADATMPGGLPGASLGSMDAPADLMDLKHAFDSAAPGVEQVVPVDIATEDMPPISPEITAAFAAPPGAGGAAADVAAGVMGTPGKTSGSGARSMGGLPATAAPQGMLFNVINAETLETAAQQVDFAIPSDAAIDKVHFTINNLAVTNLDGKATEIQQLVTEEYWPWFTNYLVVKRAAQEPNFHSLYIDLIDRFQSKSLYHLLVRTTHKYVQVLLTSDRIKRDSGERTLLKNLGSWLGSLTIKRNKPVLHKDLDLKACLFQAYEQGKLVAVIPFVDKVLEPCNTSVVFKPPNPWLMGIMSLLAEIYALEGLKLNLKFGIELIFNHTGVSTSQVKPSALLVGRQREQGASNPDFNDAVAPASPAQMGDLGMTPRALQEKLKGLPQGMHTGSGAVQPPKGLFASLHSYVQVTPPNLAPFADKLERIVPAAVDKAIYEIMAPVVERSVTIACCTAKELVCKDFSADPDEMRLRTAAHLMVSSLAGSLALVTCKEPLRLSIANQLRVLLTTILPPDQQLLENAVQQLTNDNLDLGCSLIERAAMDKAVREIDERLAGEVATRQKAKATGVPFADTQAAAVPQGLSEALRPRGGALSAFQSRVYDDFVRIPQPLAPVAARAGAPAAATAAAAAGRPPPPGGNDAQAAFPGEAPAVATLLWEKLGLWMGQLEAAVGKEPHLLFSQMPEGADVPMLVAALPEITKLGTNPEKIALGVALKIYQRLQKGMLTRALLTSTVAAMAALRDAACPKLPMEATQWLCSEDDMRLNKDIAEALARRQMLHLPQLDAALAKMITANRGAASDLAAHLLQQLVVLEPIISPNDLYATLDVLTRLAARMSNGAALMQLVEQARQAARLRAAGKAIGRMGAPPKPTADPPGLRDQVAALLDEWARQLDEAPLDKSQTAFITQLRNTGLLKGDDLTERFLRNLVELCVVHCLNHEIPAAPGRPSTTNFAAIDCFVRLVACLVQKHGGGPQLLHRVLTVMVGVMLHDAEERAAAFSSRPYFRIMLGLLSELAPTDASDVGGFACVMTCAACLHAVQPLRVPGFAFAWLELVSHRALMPKLLTAPNQRGWPMYHKLLVAALRFLEPYLRSAELSDAVRLLYKGMLRVLLVLLHDFPEFLCEYHYVLCDVVPSTCIQMRNLILSAFPRNMRLPDPFTPNLKVDLLPEIGMVPSMYPPADQLLPQPVQADVDTFLETRQPGTALTSLKSRLLLREGDPAMQVSRYSVPLVNALVCYLGAQATAQGFKVGTAAMLQGPVMDLVQRLTTELDAEGRYHLLNAIANQLRYPNSLTHYFSCVLLCLFSDAQQELVQEQITRVLLERLIVNRPHPWGLLITFIELIKNPRYNFWDHQFTRCAPEIERLFESVARSCMTTPAKGEEPLGGQQGEALRA